MYRNILIATDGSEETVTAILEGLELAKLCGACVTALHVADTTLHIHPSMPGALIAPEGALSTVRQKLLELGNNIVTEVVKKGEAMGVKVAPLVLEGDPAVEIVEISPKFDLIVMGTLSRGGLEHILLGSIAEKVVRHAPCPVLVVRSR